MLNNEVTSTDKVFYDNEPVASRDKHERWMREIECYFNGYATRLNRLLEGSTGIVAELGAGSCGLSACLSRMSHISKVYALDISRARMQKMMLLSCEILDGNLTKIESVEGDFNALLPFDDSSLDVVLFDAALHHSRTIWNLLSECRRVLRPNGVLIAQRESYLNPFRAKLQIENLLGSQEIASSVSENMYLKEQYEYYLRVNGFEVEFLPCSFSRVKSALSFLNGYLFCDGTLYCYRK